MDVLDFLENMGLGLTIVVGIILLLFVIMILRFLIPALLMGLGGLFSIIVTVILICAIIYFIGKFSKGFIKK